MVKNRKRTIALVRRELQLLVAEDSLEEAADLLSELAEICDERMCDDVAILRRGISGLNREMHLGKIGFTEATQERNRLSDRLLNIAKNLSQCVSQASVY